MLWRLDQLFLSRWWKLVVERATAITRSIRANRPWQAFLSLLWKSKVDDDPKAWKSFGLPKCYSLDGEPKTHDHSRQEFHSISHDRYGRCPRGK